MPFQCTTLRPSSRPYHRRINHTLTILQAIVLGIIQGLTEFLPISSSAHLVIAPYLLGWELPADQVFVFDVLVQMGTLLAVIVYFWKDLINIMRAVIEGIVVRKPFEESSARLGWLIALATIPASLLGLALKPQVEAVFHSPSQTALCLLVTATILALAERYSQKTRHLVKITWVDALWIGLAQAVAIFPGISRSGATISAGMARQFDRRNAGRFSFLMSIPVMLAAGGLSLVDLVAIPGLLAFMPVMAAGFAAAAVVGYFSIPWLLDFISRRPLYIFTAYCAVIAVIVLLVNYA